MSTTNFEASATHRSGTGGEARRRIGWRLLGAASPWVAYVAFAATISDYEAALGDAAKSQDTTISRLPAETVARITHDHPWSSLAAVLLFVVPALLILVGREVARVTGDSRSLWLAWPAGLVWWFYMLLNVGLVADPHDLPPLTRDLDLVSVPLVSVASVLAALSFIAAALALRTRRCRPTASTVAAVVAAVLLALGLLALLSTGFEEPVPPIVLVPSELILGIALLVGARR